MRGLILALIVSVGTNVFAGTSALDAREVYNRLVAANHITNAPTLYIENNPEVNAYQSGGDIVIYTGMLDYVKNQDELARVLGHELSHFTLRHRRSNVKNEYAADRMGGIYMGLAGYNQCRGALLLKRRGSNGGNDHPADILRYKAFHCPK